MASIWKGAISFGLVSVPVELHTAVRDSRIAFHLLHEKDESPIHFKRVREDTGDEVPWSEIVKGFEVSKGDFVVLTDKDFESAAVKQDETLDIADFADAGEVDPRYYEGVYYLVPGKGGARAYALLRDALAKTNTVGIGRIIIRQKQHIAEVRASGDSLMLMLMRFAEGSSTRNNTTSRPSRRPSPKSSTWRSSSCRVSRARSTHPSTSTSTTRTFARSSRRGRRVAR